MFNDIKIYLHITRLFALDIKQICLVIINMLGHEHVNLDTLDLNAIVHRLRLKF